MTSLRVLKTLAAAALVLASGVGLANAESRTFANPKYKGVALDYCRVWAGECGKPAADAYCRARGFKRSTGHTIYGRGVVRPTVIISNPAQKCDAGVCNAFKTITCVRPSPVKRFNSPRYEGVYVDWCESWASNCGKPAADRFCRMKGFSRSVSHSIWGRGMREPTVILSNPAQKCSGGVCNALRHVTCRR